MLRALRQRAFESLCLIDHPLHACLGFAMSRSRSLILFAAFCFFGCGPSVAKPAEAGRSGEPQRGKLNSPTASELVRELDAWDAHVEIGQRQDPAIGLGDMVVRVEGEPVWPPAGEACMPLVQCCEKLVGQDPIFAMLCQFAVAKDGNCVRGLTTITTIVNEANMPVPTQCAGQ